MLDCVFCLDVSYLDWSLKFRVFSWFLRLLGVHRWFWVFARMCFKSCECCSCGKIRRSRCTLFSSFRSSSLCLCFRLTLTSLLLVSLGIFIRFYCNCLVSELYLIVYNFRLFDCKQVLHHDLHVLSVSADSPHVRRRILLLSLNADRVEKATSSSTECCASSGNQETHFSTRWSIQEASYSSPWHNAVVGLARKVDPETKEIICKI